MKQALREKRIRKRTHLAICNAISPSVPNLKQILMSKWHLITDQPVLKEILRSYKKGRSLQDILFRAKQ